MSPNVHALDRARAPLSKVQRPDRAEVESAVRTIIRWTGEDPDRDGLRETPARVTRSLEEFFAGYGQDPVEILEKTFDKVRPWPDKPNRNGDLGWPAYLRKLDRVDPSYRN